MKKLYLFLIISALSLFACEKEQEHLDNVLYYEAETETGGNAEIERITDRGGIYTEKEMDSWLYTPQCVMKKSGERAFIGISDLDSTQYYRISVIYEGELIAQKQGTGGDAHVN